MIYLLSVLVGLLLGYVLSTLLNKKRYIVTRRLYKEKILDTNFATKICDLTGRRALVSRWRFCCDSGKSFYGRPLSLHEQEDTLFILFSVEDSDEKEKRFIIPLNEKSGFDMLLENHIKDPYMALVIQEQYKERFK